MSSTPTVGLIWQFLMILFKGVSEASKELTFIFGHSEASQRMLIVTLYTPPNKWLATTTTIFTKSQIPAKRCRKDDRIRTAPFGISNDKGSRQWPQRKRKRTHNLQGKENYP